MHEFFVVKYPCYSHGAGCFNFFSESEHRGRTYVLDSTPNSPSNATITLFDLATFARLNYCTTANNLPNLKKYVLTALKILFPLALGIYLVWYFYKELKAEDQLDQLADAFARADYFWVLLSLIIATLSHLSRAYRWKYTLQPLGYKPDFLNSFFAVMGGYLINLAVPRLGELSRCGIMQRYEKIPFEKLLGTVIAERVADMLILLATITTIVFLQYDVLQDMLNEILAESLGEISGSMVITILLALFAAGAGTLIFVFKLKTENKFIRAVQKVIKGIMEGLAGIYKMKHKWYFLAHTVFIWFAYLMMFYVCFFALPETTDVPMEGVFTAFGLGGLAIAVTNGGIGAYPLAVQAILLLYDVDKVTGGAFGWIVWAAQTAMILILGGISFAIISTYNKRRLSKVA